MQQRVKTFPEFVNEALTPAINSDAFLVQLADLIRETGSFETVSVEGNYLEFTSSEAIHDRGDRITDGDGEEIRIYADYLGKAQPIFKISKKIGMTEFNDLVEHGIISLSEFVKSFNISSEVNVWSKDLSGWTFDDGSDEMEEVPLSEMEISSKKPSIELLATTLAEYMNDQFNLFYTASDVIQSSIDNYCEEYGDDEDEDEEEHEDY